MLGKTTFQFRAASERRERVDEGGGVGEEKCGAARPTLHARTAAGASSDVKWAVSDHALLVQRDEAPSGRLLPLTPQPP